MLFKKILVPLKYKQIDNYKLFYHKPIFKIVSNTMVINLITFASLLHKQASVRSSHEIILTELEKIFHCQFQTIKILAN